MDCKICGKPDEQKPMAFRGEPYCSELHRKALLKQPVGQKNENSVVE